jgi:hypothetical protein
MVHINQSRRAHMTLWYARRRSEQERLSMVSWHPVLRLLLLQTSGKRRETQLLLQVCALLCLSALSLNHAGFVIATYLIFDCIVRSEDGKLLLKLSLT